MPTTPMTPNMAFATGAAAAAASARETAARVAAGGVARLIIPEVRIRAYLVELGGDAIDRDVFDADADRSQSASSAPTPPPQRAGRRRLDASAQGRLVARRGRRMRRRRRARPAGARRVYAKLDAELAAAMMSINAAKGVEIGDGFCRRAPARRGQCRRDARPGPTFLSNHAGGILGGISTGQPVVVRVAFKPTSSILTPMPTIDRDGNETEIVDQGPARSVRRHPRRADRRGDDGAGPRRPEAAPPRAVRLSRMTTVHVALGEQFLRRSYRARPARPRRLLIWRRSRVTAGCSSSATRLSGPRSAAACRTASRSVDAEPILLPPGEAEQELGRARGRDRPPAGAQESSGATISSPLAAEWSATSPASPRRSSTAAAASCRSRPTCSPRSTARSAARPRSTSRPARISSAPSTSLRSVLIDPSLPRHARSARASRRLCRDRQICADRGCRCSPGSTAMARSCSPATRSAEHAITAAVAGKAAIVAADERETGGRRALLNLGHTFGHALEAETGFSDLPAARRGGRAWMRPRLRFLGRARDFAMHCRRPSGARPFRIASACRPRSASSSFGGRANS